METSLSSDIHSKHVPKFPYSLVAFGLYLIRPWMIKTSGNKLALTVCGSSWHSVLAHLYLVFLFWLICLYREVAVQLG